MRDPLQPTEPRALLNATTGACYDWDLVSDEMAWSANICDLLGLTHGGHVATGALWQNLLAPESPAAPKSSFPDAGTDLGTGVPYQLSYALVVDPGERAPRTWIEDTGRWFAGADGRPLRAHGVIRVTAAPACSGTAQHGDDRLTGALTRTQLIERMLRMFNHATRARSQFALLLVGFDNLAAVNRDLGDEAGDAMVAAATAHLRRSMRTTDTLARYSGAKCALLLDCCAPERMDSAIRRFMQEATRPITVEGKRIVPQVRIGAASAPLHARNPQVLMQQAEEAFGLARERPTLFAIYDPAEARASARARMDELRDLIIAALNDRRIEIELENIVDARSGETRACEALMRLRLENGETLAPAAIVTTAERLGLIELLDQRVLELALDHLRADASRALNVNMSGMTLHSPDTLARLTAIAKAEPALVRRLTIEITETTLIEDMAATAQVVAALKALGLSIALDDFGAGHTSFRHLRSLDLDYIKIDGAFMQNIARSSDDRFFVRTLVQLARHLRVPTVAEWVSDPHTAELLRTWGVDYLQGDLYGRAMAARPAPLAAEEAAA